MATVPPRSPLPKSAYLALLGLLLVPAAVALFVLGREDRERDRVPEHSFRPRPSARPVAVMTRSEPPGPRVEPDAGRPGLVEPELPSLRRREPTEPHRQPAAADAAPSDENIVQDKIDESRRIATTDPARSRELLREALELDPDNVPALESLSLKMVSDENQAQARKLAEHCLEVNEDDETCAKVKDFTVERSAKVYKMVGLMRKCIEEEPTNVLCLSSMVEYHVYEGRPDDAKKLSDQIAKLAPGSAFADFAEAKVRSTTGDYREARILFQNVCAQGNDEACFRADALSSEGW